MRRMFSMLVFVAVTVAFIIPSAIAETPDTSEFVKLKMYLMGDGAPEAQMVWDEVNKMLKEDINAEVEVIFVPWAGRQDKVRLLLASGEEFDLIFAAEWNLFREQVELGSYYPISELLPIYAPQTWESLPKEAWQESTYQDEIYMVPYNSFEFNTHGAMYRLDLAQKYGLPNGIKSVDDLELFCEKFKEEFGILPMNVGTPEYMGYELWRTESSMRQYPLQDIRVGVAEWTGLGMWHYLDDPENPFFELESPGWKDWTKRAKRWADKGFWSRSAVSKETFSRQEFENGNSAVGWLNPLQGNEYYQRLKTANPEAEYDWWNTKSEYPVMRRRTLIGNGMAVNANATNPERALMLLELLHNDQRYFDLTTFGIQGKHWELDTEDNIVMPEGLSPADSGYPWDRACPWGWREDKFYRVSPLTSNVVWPVVKDLYKKWAANWTVWPYGDFTLDLEPIRAEVNAISEVGVQYGPQLMLGLVDDPDATYYEYMQKLKEAGFEKYKAEVLKQWKEYLASKK